MFRYAIVLSADRPSPEVSVTIGIESKCSITTLDQLPGRELVHLGDR